MSRVSSCCIDPAQGWRWRTCPFPHSILQQELPTAASHLGAFPHRFGCAHVPVKPSPRLRQKESVVLARDGLGVLCSTEPMVSALWRLSALWPYPPFVGLKHFSVARECGNADQAVLEADKTLFAFGILRGRKMWLKCFYILSASVCCGAEKSLW